MFYDVYVLGGKGGDPVDALRAGPKRGELIIKKRFFNSPDESVTAELLDAQTGLLLTPLQHVRIVPMDRKGMTIEGTQAHQLRQQQESKVEHFAQRWLCRCRGPRPSSTRRGC